MGKRGPRRKPMHLKLISGTARRDRPDDAPPTIAPMQVAPPPPKWLPNKLARDEWTRCTRILAGLGKLDVARLALIETYSALHGTMAAALKSGATPRASLLAEVNRMRREVFGGVEIGRPAGAAEKPANVFAQLREESDRYYAQWPVKPAG
jgi:hypothetical protein